MIRRRRRVTSRRWAATRIPIYRLGGVGGASNRHGRVRRASHRATGADRPAGHTRRDGGVIPSRSHLDRCPGGGRPRGPWRGGLVARGGRVAAVSRVTRLMITPPPAVGLTTNTGDRVFAIAPDGTRIAYIGGPAWQLYTQGLDQVEPTLLAASPATRRGPFFSPDGTWVGYFVGNDRPEKDSGDRWTRNRPLWARRDASGGELGTGRRHGLRDRQSGDGPLARGGRRRGAETADTPRRRGWRVQSPLARVPARRARGAVYDPGQKGGPVRSPRGGARSSNGPAQGHAAGSPQRAVCRVGAHRLRRRQRPPGDCVRCRAPGDEGHPRTGGATY